MDIDRIQYISVVLTPSSVDRLKSILHYHNFIIPEHWTEYMHHMTVFFKKKRDVIPLQDMPPLGTMVELDPISCYKDENGMCLSVLPHPSPDILKMQTSQKPHITIACAPGIMPVYSNGLMTKLNVIQFNFNEHNDSNNKLCGRLCAVGYDSSIFPSTLTTLLS